MPARNPLLALLVTLAAGCLLAPAGAAAQSYPSRPIRWIVPFPAGGPLDVVARLVARPLAEQVGQPVVIDNRPGANGILGTELAARAAADGHTLVTGAPGTIAINPALYKMAFDPVKDLVAITQFVSGSFVLVVGNAVPARTLAEFVAFARQRPGALNYASYGSGSSPHIAMEMLKRAAGIDLVHVPYKGSPAAMADMATGQVAAMFETPISAAPQARAGRLRALAVSVRERHPMLPEAPPVSDTYPGFHVDGWQGVFAPAGTPREVVALLNREMVRIVRSSEVSKRFTDLASEPVGNTPEEFAAKVASDALTWARVIREVGIKAD